MTAFNQGEFRNALRLMSPPNPTTTPIVVTIADAFTTQFLVLTFIIGT
jgi:hypothetical protein